MSVNTEGTVHSAPSINSEHFTLDDDAVRTLATFAGGSSPYPRAFMVDVAGVLSILNLNDTVVQIPVLAGIIYPIAAKRYRLTGTTGPTFVVGLS